MQKPNEAVRLLYENLVAIVGKTIQEKEDIEHFAEFLRSTECEELWGYFRYCDALLAKEGKNLNSFFELKHQYERGTVTDVVTTLKVDGSTVIFTEVRSVA